MQDPLVDHEERSSVGYESPGRPQISAPSVFPRAHVTYSHYQQQRRHRTILSALFIYHCASSDLIVQAHRRHSRRLWRQFAKETIAEPSPLHRNLVAEKSIGRARHFKCCECLHRIVRLPCCVVPYHVVPCHTSSTRRSRRKLPG